ncbi:nitrogen fixation protein FixH [Flammeovirgaceae bacterium 311]|nr:nitrogen fixation protein FixH [Flammeovirgaceae bacterium 311]
MTKFNWGHGIIVFFCCFISFMGYLAYRSSKENIDLVTEDYYKQELGYGSQMDKMRNAQALAKPVQVMVEGRAVAVAFPALEGVVSGEIQMFRPSDAQFDRTVAITPDASGKQQLDVTDLPAGLYRLKIDWKAGDKSFYTEEAINLQ